MSTRLDRFVRHLSDLQARDRRRALQGRAGFDFASNDYLGLAEDPALVDAVRAALARAVPVGAAGSRLLRGNHREHQMLEEEAARFFGAPRALFFGGGYAANLALFSTLPDRGDFVVWDELSHASTREGVRAGRAEAAPFRHSDAGHAEALIAGWRARGGTGAPWIAVESVYSMDGDRAPLSELLALAERHDGFLVVDEAHATGVFGEGGRGLTAALKRSEALVALHTCGKALGASGALVTGAAPLLDFIVNRARPFIFATAPSPLMAAAVRASLRLLEEQPERRTKLGRLVAHAGLTLQRRLGVAPSGSQIQPIILGTDERAMRVAAALRDAGFDCRAVRPPTVPEGTARLRISLTLNVDSATVDALADALAVGGVRPVA
jgi:8-amino-7-oxononanoate synthase